PDQAAPVFPETRRDRAEPAAHAVRPQGTGDVRDADRVFAARQAAGARAGEVAPRPAGAGGPVGPARRRRPPGGGRDRGQRGGKQPRPRASARPAPPNRWRRPLPPGSGGGGPPRGGGRGRGPAGPSPPRSGPKGDKEDPMSVELQERARPARAAAPP